MKDYIVDASVVAKWLLPEPGHERAKRVIDSPFYLRAPDVLAAEFGNILFKKVVRREISIAESRELLDIFLNEYLDTRVKVIPARLVASAALRIAMSEGRSFYDSLYLALAVQAQCALITADEKLVRGIKDKHLGKHVIALNDPALELG